VRLDHVQGRDPFRVPIGLAQTSVDKAVSVLDQHVPHEKERRFLAVESRLGIGCRGMSVVRSLLAAKIRFLLPPPPSAGGSSDSSFGLKLFIDAPGFDQCPIDREMIRAEKPLHPRLR
jgi:hypothetical protein